MSKNKPVEIVPGLYQIALPIPIKSLRTVFVYLARDDHENLLIDSGWNDEESYIALTNSFAEIDFSIKDVNNLVISHLHPDHFGLSERIKKEAPQAKIFMHSADAKSLQENVEDHARFIANLHDWLRVQGTPEKVLNEMLGSSALEKFISPAQPDVKLNGGEILKVGKRFSFEVIHTPGHTIGQVCLYDRGGSNLLFSGDHVLPTITPNVSLSPLYEGDPLGDYIKSLEALKKINVSKVLPSHEYVFDNLQKRLEEIEEHHVARLQNTLDVVNSGNGAMSGYEVASKLHWYTGSWEKLTAWEKRAAVMETLAHLEHLKRNGKVTEAQEGVGDDMQVRYLSMSNC